MRIFDPHLPAPPNDQYAKDLNYQLTVKLRELSVRTDQLKDSLLSSPPSVTGSRGGNAALASLLTALDGLGLITDSTTA